MSFLHASRLFAHRNVTFNWIMCKSRVVKPERVAGKYDTGSQWSAQKIKKTPQTSGLCAENDDVNDVRCRFNAVSFRTFYGKLASLLNWIELNWFILVFIEREKQMRLRINVIEIAAADMDNTRSTKTKWNWWQIEIDVLDGSKKIWAKKTSKCNQTQAKTVNQTKQTEWVIRKCVDKH